jgi:hypothetical protein
MPQPLPSTIHDPATGGVIPASWGDAVNEFCDDRDTGPAARVYRSSSQAIPSGTWTTVTFDSERYDTADLHEAAINPSRLTAPAGKGGVYLVWFGGQLADTPGQIQARLRANGGIVYAVHGVYDTGDDSPAYRYFQVAALIPMAAGDYVEAQVYHNHGSASNLQAVNYYSPEFAMHRLGPHT